LRSGDQGQRRFPALHRAADRHRDGRRQGVPRHAGRLRRFETNIRKERQLEGIAKAKVAGVYKARPAKLASAVGDKVAEMRAAGMGASEIADKLKIARRSVYRLLDGNVVARS
jgi:DNA invertase Pin-like site-specific DNA recombinase